MTPPITAAKMMLATDIRNRVLTAPNAAEAENAAVILVNRPCARNAKARSRSAPAIGAAGDKRASMTDIVGAASVIANDIVASPGPMNGSGSAASTQTRTADKQVVAKHASTSNITASQAIMRTNTAQVPTAAAATSAFGAPGPPGTATSPASAAKPVAISPNIRLARSPLNTRPATAAAARDRTLAAAATPTQPARCAALASNAVRSR